MYRINGPTVAATMPPISTPGTPGYHTVGNTALGIPASIVTADFLNTIQEELLAVIADAGIAPAYNVLTQVRDAIRVLVAAETSVLVTTSTTLAPNSGIVNVNASAGPITITLPAAAGGSGRPLNIRFVRLDQTGNTVTVQRQGSDTIRSATSIVLPITTDVTLHGDGAANWYPSRLGTYIGEVRAFATPSLPPGWLYPDGSNVSRTSYSALFAAIGGTYGAGNGTSTFGLPDLRGRSILGRDDMGGATASRITAAVSGMTGTTLGAAGGSQAMPLHNHGLVDPGHAHAVYDPGHAHAVSDPTHSHYVNDPTHGHSGGTTVAPDHAHGGVPLVVPGGDTDRGIDYAPSIFSVDDYGVTSPGGAHAHSLIVNGAATGIFLSQAGTGISIYGAGTGISIYGAGTGISIANAGSGGSGNVHPSLVLNYGIHAGV